MGIDFSLYILYDSIKLVRLLKILIIFEYALKEILK